MRLSLTGRDLELHGPGCGARRGVDTSGVGELGRLRRGKAGCWRKLLFYSQICGKVAKLTFTCMTSFFVCLFVFG